LHNFGLQWPVPLLSCSSICSHVLKVPRNTEFETATVPVLTV